MKKYLPAIIFSIIAASVVSIFLAVVVVDLTTENIPATLQETFDEVDRERAIMELSELRGRILEIKSLSNSNIQSYVLQDKLDEIIFSQNFTNPYLSDFTFIIPNTSIVGKLCEDLISQIDDQICIIKFGTEDAYASSVLYYSKLICFLTYLPESFLSSKLSIFFIPLLSCKISYCFLATSFNRSSLLLCSIP